MTLATLAKIGYSISVPLIVLGFFLCIVSKCESLLEDIGEWVVGTGFALFFCTHLGVGLYVLWRM